MPRWGGQINPGRHEIHQYRDRADKHRLERFDSNFGDDWTPEGRSELRLHSPGVFNMTTGCIKICTEEETARVTSIIQNTSTTTLEVASQSDRPFASSIETLRTYGTLRVLPNGYSLIQDPRTGAVNIQGVPTGSRIERTICTFCTFDKEGRCN